MKLEQLLAKCPKCGSQDKTVQRKMLDDQKAHAEMKAVVCDECGYIFETKEDQEEKYKEKEKEEIKKGK
ncbi:TIGR04165 family Cys-rich peptide [Methanobrevibacter sp. TMH8]|uniref:TIGR04165 family Cys-rich peptide n=1 Tax=Methanobrevibacter sp. TMH8 TaxID=2848611 RepID=UPI001CCCA558|nr:TIGR04165 family Cys-rich peptide [Methanobrevibacter sp. TMH8]MBZ9571014.1 TIGR04165 family Cys-rich peptide [Methanobrevibacter sp. TMH8]